MSTTLDQMDIAHIIGKLSDSPVRGSAYVRQVKALMQHFAAHGVSLEIARDARHLGISEHTAKAYARQFKLSFSDYVPRELQPKKEKPAKAKKLKAAA